MKTAIITGVRTNSLGILAAQVFAEQNYNLVLVSRNGEHLNDAKALLESVVLGYAASISCEQCDVRDYKSVVSSLSPYQSVDVLVNAAGVLGPTSNFAQNEMSLWADCIMTNVVGTANVCHALLNKFSQTTRGKIINFSGGGGGEALVNHSAYGASKAAAIRFTESLALEFPGIDSNIIAPGRHNTNIQSSETAIDLTKVSWANPERYKGLVRYLGSEKSDGVTGRFINILDNWDAPDFANLKPDYLKLRRVDEILLRRVADGQK